MRWIKANGGVEGMAKRNEEKAKILYDEIDDPDGDWEDVIEQLDDSGYLSEDDGDLFFEDSRVRFDDDEEFIDIENSKEENLNVKKDNKKLKANVSKKIITNFR